MAAPQQPLCPPRRRKGKKRPNLYSGPEPEAPPGEKIKYSEDTMRLPIYGDGINPLVDDHGFPDRQADLDFLID